jgi:hypothetical protein
MYLTDLGQVTVEVKCYFKFAARRDIILNSHFFGWLSKVAETET